MRGARGLPLVNLLFPTETLLAIVSVNILAEMITVNHPSNDVWSLLLESRQLFQIALQRRRKLDFDYSHEEAFPVSHEVGKWAIDKVTAHVRP